MNRRALLVYLPYAWLAPSLPLSWPIPPLDLVLLLGASLADEVVPTFLALLAVDVALGQPSCPLRWTFWLLWLAMLGWQRTRLHEPQYLVGLTLVGGMLWYWLVGPALSGWSALAVALQGLGILLWWRPQNHQERWQGWGWRRS